MLVGADVLRSARRAIRAGHVRSLDEWARTALEERAENDRRRDAARRAVRAFEEKHGRFTPEELAAQARRDKRNAVRVRAAGTSPRRVA